MKSLSKPMRELIGACAAHGLEFWGKAPGPAMVWAVGPGQSWHLVKVHRSRGESSHACGRWLASHQFTGSCRGSWHALPYSVPESLAECASLFEPEPEGMAAA